MQQLTIRRPDDWHLHLRDGAALAAVLPHTTRRFARAVIMPNLTPPVTTVAAALAYRQRIVSQLPAGTPFTPLMTLYLTDSTAPEEIDRAAASDAVIGCKLYPAGATTHSEAGVTDVRKLDRVLERMSERGLVLQVHGEVTVSSRLFDQNRYIEQVLAPMVERWPQLRVVFERDFTHRGQFSALPAAALPRLSRLSTCCSIAIPTFRAACVRTTLPAGTQANRTVRRCWISWRGDARFFLSTDSAPHSARQGSRLRLRRNVQRRDRCT
jgi:dihydroorotase